METRKITITTTRMQGSKTIMTDASTLGELKNALTANGIDYTDMAFYEGISRTELVDDNSQLPQNVMYKGNVTNDLVFMLTTQNKKIKSGWLTEQRRLAYKAIRDNNLMDECVRRFGKNFTQCTTTDLLFLIKNTTPSSTTKCEDGTVDKVARKVLCHLIEELYEDGSLSSADCAEMRKALKVECDSNYSEDEISKMFEFLK